MITQYHGYRCYSDGVIFNITGRSEDKGTVWAYTRDKQGYQGYMVACDNNTLDLYCQGHTILSRGTCTQLY
jgi:hypothetical protein